jgi:hypothetical protein
MPEPMPLAASADVAQDERALVEGDAMESAAPADADEFRMVPQPAEILATDAADGDATITDRPARRSLVRKVRDWLRRAA